MYTGFARSDNPADAAALKELGGKLSEYYNTNQTESYWEAADAANKHYTQTSHPYHIDLLERISLNNGPIADLGCGSAHLLHNVKAKVRYCGVDWSERQILENQERYKNAVFQCSNIYETGLPSEQFEWVLSFYALEHCVYPKKLLAEMIRLVKPSGRIAIICPHFRPGVMNSMWFGKDPRPTREKFRHGLWGDLILDLWERAFTMRRRLMNAHKKQGDFLVLKNPRCLYAPYYSDRDAVYWSYWPEIRDYLREQGMDVIVDHDNLGNPIARTIYFIAVKK